MGEVRDTSKVNIGSSACEVQHGSGASKASKVNIGSSACKASTEVLLRAKSLGGSWWWSEDMAWSQDAKFGRAQVALWKKAA